MLYDIIIFQSNHSEFVGIQSPHYTAQQTRKPQILSLQPWKPQIPLPNSLAVILPQILLDQWRTLECIHQVSTPASAAWMMGTQLVPSWCEHTCTALSVVFDVTCTHSRLSQREHLTHDVEPVYYRGHKNTRRHL